jgi:hemerythrin superfamily protein
MPSKPKAPRNASVAVELLISDHRNVEALFKQFEDEEETDARRETALRICKELTVHATVEEELFYPFVRENIEETDLVDEADVEHGTAKDLIAQIEAAEEVDDKFDAKVKVLKEYIKHHVEEEENEMFPKLAGFKEELDELGQQMHERKLELLDEVGLLEPDAKASSAAARGPKAAPAPAASRGGRGRGE